MKIYVGDDIVDLAAANTNAPEQQARFMARVLSPREQKHLALSANPQQDLWKLWSAKEAAFKIVKKLIPHLVFEHQQFVVTVLGELHGQVVYQD